MIASAPRGLLPLVTASLIWGTAFLPQAITVRSFDGLWACALRFGLALPFALLLSRGRLRTGLPLPVALAFGVLLYGAFLAQTEALRHTSVARVSLITGLYAVLTPMLAPLLGMRRPARLQMVGALVAFAGLWGLTGTGGAETPPWNLGDLLTLLHAGIAALHILLVGRYAHQADSHALNAVQIACVAGLAWPTAWALGAPPAFGELQGVTLASFLYLALFSSVIAFALQLHGQRQASPSLCAVLFLLESPIGVALAALILHEAMRPAQWLGAAVLLSGIGLSLYGELRRAPGAAPVDAASAAA